MGMYEGKDGTMIRDMKVMEVRESDDVWQGEEFILEHSANGFQSYIWNITREEAHALLEQLGEILTDEVDPEYPPCVGCGDVVHIASLDDTLTCRSCGGDV